MARIMHTKSGKVNQMKFDELQKDQSVDDVQVQWCGDLVRLYRNTRTLTVLRADNTAEKIKRWCEKNTYRCSAIRYGRIWI